MRTYLSKSDFKVARTCQTKLYYKKNGYKTTNDANEYLQLLAEGGYIVEKMAHLLFPDGQYLPATPQSEKAFAQTVAALAAENVILFEPTIISGGKLARIDALVKNGDRIDLYEIKAKPFDTVENQKLIDAGGKNLFHTKRGTIRSGWLPYLEDVTFQTLVLTEYFPDAIVTPYLITPDKSVQASADALFGQFFIDASAEFAAPTIDYLGDESKLQNNHILTITNVANEVAELAASVAEWTTQFQNSLQPMPVKVETELSINCRHCEYKLAKDAEKNGFLECWGELADADPHILDMYRVDSVGGRKRQLANQLIQEGKTSLFDIPLDAVNPNPEKPASQLTKRQLIQLTNMRDNTEWVSGEFAEILQGFTYPLQFIDFETTTVAIPYYTSLKPFEAVAFQWSCHTLAAADGELQHHEWLNTQDDFPNFAFAEALMEQLDLSGTVFIWSPHETTILRTILRQLEQRPYHNPRLEAWLRKLVGGENSLFVDMNALTLKHYFHPLMKGRTSIKIVSDAIWKSNAALRTRFSDFVRESDGVILSPYETLPLMSVGGETAVIKEGTGAILGYQTMLYSQPPLNTEEQQQWLKLLLQYCHLDTLAMVMIWYHWQGLIG